MKKALALNVCEVVVVIGLLGIVVGRKSLSLVNIAGVYFLEWFAAVLVLCMVANLLLDGAQRISRASVVIPSSAHWFALAYVAYGIGVAFWYSRPIAKELLIAVYPMYVVLGGQLSGYIDRRRFLIWVVALYSLVPFGSSLYSIFLEGWLGPRQAPGDTYFAAVAILLSLLFWKRTWISILSASIAGVYGLVLFERGVFLCLFLGAGLVFSVSGSADLIRRAWTRFALVGCLMLLTIPIVASGIDDARFRLSPGNVLKFATSIVSSEVVIDGARVGKGTRDHRIEMWSKTVRKASDNPGGLLLGHGFSEDLGMLVGSTFRSIHNGFLTIGYRVGLLGLFLYLVMLWRIIVEAVATKESLTIVIVLVSMGSFVGDGLTGTIIDSPFGSAFFFLTMGVLTSRKRVACPSGVPK